MDRAANKFSLLYERPWTGDDAPERFVPALCMEPGPNLSHSGRVSLDRRRDGRYCEYRNYVGRELLHGFNDDQVSMVLFTEHSLSG